MKKKRIGLVLMVLLINTFFMSMNGEVWAKDTTEVVTPSDKDPKPVDKYDSEWLPIKRLGPRTGIIMKDIPQIPGSPGEALSMTKDPPAGHTGWSAVYYACNRYLSHWEQGRSPETGELAFDKNGNPVMFPRYVSTWENDGSYHTNNKSDSGLLSDYAGQLSAMYGNMGRDINWGSARGYLEGVDHWPVYQYNGLDKWVGRGDCENGDEEYLYINNDILMEGAVQVHLPDPTNTKEAPNRNTGAVKGEVYWEMRRDSDKAPSNVHALVDLAIDGEHYATRKPENHMTFNGKKVSGAEAIKAMADAATVKGKKLEYGFTYEYTNHYRDIYKCSDSEGGYCYQWTFDKRVPDWNYVKKFEMKDSITIDHRQYDNIKGETFTDTLEKSYLVGRKDTWKKGVKTSRAYYESWQADAAIQSRYDLLSQATLPLTPGTITYHVSLPSDEHKKQGFNAYMKGLSHGHMNPADIDESLMQNYRNKIEGSTYKYAFPLQQEKQQDKGMINGKRVFAMPYVSDLFHLTRHTGFLMGYPYAADVRKQLLDGTKVPTHQELMRVGAEMTKSHYQNLFKTPLVDEFMYTKDTKEDYAKLQRYYIPLRGSSPLKPETVYKNHYYLKDMGLNDLNLEYNVSFTFEHYLFGSGADNAFYIEQKDSRVPVAAGTAKNVYIKYEDLAKFHALQEERKKQKRVHEIRISDRAFVDKVKEIVDVGL